ncbi:MAG TPA: DUF1934 family protein [Mollicutes bacterium]|nr:DUF1934 family protein [Mollicutes bacterium]
MKKVKIKMSIIDGLGEECFINEVGTYNEKEKTIIYKEENVSVKIIMEDKIIIERENQDYSMKLIFEEQKVHNSSYNIYKPKMVLDLSVNTLILKRNVNSFYIKYKLVINNEDMGIFTVDFKWEVQ